MKQEYLYIAYSYDDPDNAAVLVSANSLTEIKDDLEGLGGFIYRYLIGDNNELTEESFVQHYKG